MGGVEWVGGAERVGGAEQMGGAERVGGVEQMGGVERVSVVWVTGAGNPAVIRLQVLWVQVRCGILLPAGIPYPLQYNRGFGHLMGRVTHGYIGNTTSWGDP
jgi:hypothetical protein